jgi:hypothetical protein
MVASCRTISRFECSHNACVVLAFALAAFLTPALLAIYVSSAPFAPMGRVVFCAGCGWRDGVPIPGSPEGVISPISTSNLYQDGQSTAGSGTESAEAKSAGASEFETDFKAG